MPPAARKARRVLIADHDEFAADFLCATLDSSFGGIEVRRVENGDQALAAAQESHFDLIIADSALPGLDGRALASALASRGVDLPLLLMTRDDASGRIDDAPDPGVTWVLDKPIDVDQLVELCSLHLHDGVRGVLEGVSLEGLLQLLEHESRSCMLEITNERELVRVGVEAGRIIHCEGGGRWGIAALADALTWRSPSFQLNTLDRFGRLDRDMEPVAIGSAIFECTRHESPSSPVHSSPGVDPAALGHAAATSESSMHLAVQAAMALDGALAFAIVDYESGLCLGAAAREGFPIDVAAAGNREVVRAKVRVMEKLDIDGPIEDILISLRAQYHLMRPSRAGSLFLYLAIEKREATLALARHRLAAIEAALVI